MFLDTLGSIGWKWSEERDQIEAIQSLLLKENAVVALSPSRHNMCVGLNEKIVFLHRKKEEKFFFLSGSISLPSGIQVSQLVFFTVRRLTPVHGRHGKKKRKAVLFAGCSDGTLMICDASNAAVILSEKIHPSPVRKMKLCPGDRFEGGESVDDLLILFEPNVVAIVPHAASEVIRAALAYPDYDSGRAMSIVNYQYELMQQSSVDDVVCFSDTDLDTMQPRLRFVSVGLNPMVCAYAVSVDDDSLSDARERGGPGRGVRGSGSLLGAAKTWLKGKGGGKGGIRDNFVRSITPVLSLSDSRRISQIEIDPLGGGLAFMADSLGRVILMDLDVLVCFRMWKGYRGAQCSWNVADVDESGSDGRGARSRSLLFFLTHMPSLGLLEVWGMRSGRRCDVCRTTRGSRMLYSHGQPILLKPSGEIQLVEVDDPLARLLRNREERSAKSPNSSDSSATTRIHDLLQTRRTVFASSAEDLQVENIESEILRLVHSVKSPDAMLEIVASVVECSAPVQVMVIDQALALELGTEENANMEARKRLVSRFAALEAFSGVSTKRPALRIAPDMCFPVILQVMDGQPYVESRFVVQEFVRCFQVAKGAISMNGLDSEQRVHLAQFLFRGLLSGHIDLCLEDLGMDRDSEAEFFTLFFFSIPLRTLVSVSLENHSTTLHSYCEVLCETVSCREILFRAAESSKRCGHALLLASICSRVVRSDRWRNMQSQLQALCLCAASIPGEFEVSAAQLDTEDRLCFAHFCAIAEIEPMGVSESLMMRFGVDIMTLNAHVCLELAHRFSESSSPSEQLQEAVEYVSRIVHPLLKQKLLFVVLVDYVSPFLVQFAVFLEQYPADVELKSLEINNRSVSSEEVLAVLMHCLCILAMIDGEGQPMRLGANVQSPSPFVERCMELRLPLPRVLSEFSVFLRVVRFTFAVRIPFVNVFELFSNEFVSFLVQNSRGVIRPDSESIPIVNDGLESDFRRKFIRKAVVTLILRERGEDGDALAQRDGLLLTPSLVNSVISLGKELGLDGDSVRTSCAAAFFLYEMDSLGFEVARSVKGDSEIGELIVMIARQRLALLGFDLPPKEYSEAEMAFLEDFALQREHGIDFHPSMASIQNLLKTAVRILDWKSDTSKEVVQLLSFSAR